MTQQEINKLCAYNVVGLCHHLRRNRARSGLIRKHGATNKCSKKRCRWWSETRDRYFFVTWTEPKRRGPRYTKPKAK